MNKLDKALTSAFHKSVERVDGEEGLKVIGKSIAKTAEQMVKDRRANKENKQTLDSFFGGM